MSDIDKFLLNRLDKLDEKLDAINVSQAKTHTALESHEKRDEEMRANIGIMSVETSKNSQLLSDYNTSLREHMRRTRLLENKVEPMYKEWSDDHTVKKHQMKTWKKVVAIAAGLTTIIGLLVGFANLMGML